MLELDVSIVAYAPDPGLLRRLFASLAETTGARLNLFVEDNGPAAAHGAAPIESVLDASTAAAFASVRFSRSGTNLGFGRGHNANAGRGRAPWILVINPDCVLEPGALDALAACAASAAPDVAALEMRQVPYEHPKAYDPVTLETGWVSGAASLFRRTAFEAVGGFDARIFMYGEDVDLSWRLRAAGWRLLYQPRCAVLHLTYREPGEVKPLALYEGTLTHLCLRARYAGFVRTVKGLAKLAREIARPQAFPGRRRGLARAGVRFLARWPQFAFSPVRASGRFAPRFASWDYEQHRDGAFHPFASRRDTPPADEPRVSILIRTCGRPAWLREALLSCAHQTYRNLEVVVVEGGPPRSAAVVGELAGRLDIRYHATGEPTTRGHNGNIALSLASGEWMNFLDDDDVFFADHVEVVLGAARAAGLRGAYALAWESRTRFIDRDAARYEEVENVTRHAQPFDRMVLWHHNYLPIQSVMFHRSLYERHGGFDEALEQLEDWNLWTRYTLEDDFVMVPKTTSKYRVPADWHEAVDRQARLDAAYAAALERQGAMRARLSPREVLAMAEAHARRHRLLARIPGARSVLRRLEEVRE